MNSEWHIAMFSDFCHKVKQISGATPHLRTVGESCRECDEKETAWRGGLYAACYNYPAAEAIWLTWQPEWVLKNQFRFCRWVEENWKGLPLRKERKAVNSVKKLSECIIGYAAWQLQGGLTEMYQAVNRAKDPYQAAWERFSECKYMGRYITIRYLEFMRRYAQLNVRMNDARAKGGEHPRQGLHLLIPEQALIRSDSPEDLQISEAAFKYCLSLLRERQVFLDHYELQSLVCEYKQAALGKHQYPVQALDSELGYYAKVVSHFGDRYAERSQFFRVRSSLFPEQALGELSGWPGKRKELGIVLACHGYNWSDLLYDYKRTTDLAHPVRWNDAESISDHTEPTVSQGSLF